MSDINDIGWTDQQLFEYLAKNNLDGPLFADLLGQYLRTGLVTMPDWTHVPSCKDCEGS